MLNISKLRQFVPLQRNLTRNICKMPTKSLLTAEECVSLSSSPRVKFVDASWYLDKSRDFRVEFLTERIAGSVHFDLDSVCDKTSDLPHMLPSNEQFADAVADLGISNEDHVVVYTMHNCSSAPRVWWTFKAFGHEKVSILNGGINAWKAAGGKTDVGALPEIPRGTYTAKLNHKMVVDWKEVLDIVNTGKSQLVDARPNARFIGEAPEPRANCRQGHAPGALNVPFASLLKEGDFSTMKSPEEIRDILVNAGVIFGSRMVLSCGSGVTAAVVCFALHQVGKDIENSPIYDGSWAEWGANNDLPCVK